MMSSWKWDESEAEEKGVKEADFMYACVRNTLQADTVHVRQYTLKSLMCFSVEYQEEWCNYFIY